MVNFQNAGYILALLYAILLVINHMNAKHKKCLVVRIIHAVLADLFAANFLWWAVQTVFLIFPAIS